VVSDVSTKLFLNIIKKLKLKKKLLNLTKLLILVLLLIQTSLFTHSINFFKKYVRKILTKVCFRTKVGQIQASPAWQLSPFAGKKVAIFYSQN